MHIEAKLRRTFTIAHVLRLILGVAVMLGVYRHVDQIQADISAFIPRGDLFSIPAYITAMTAGACIGYGVARVFTGRVISVLIAAVCCVYVSGRYGRYKIYDAREFAIIGLVFAVALFVAFGWLDNGRRILMHKSPNHTLKDDLAVHRRTT